MTPPPFDPTINPPIHPCNHTPTIFSDLTWPYPLTHTLTHPSIGGGASTNLQSLIISIRSSFIKFLLIWHYSTNKPTHSHTQLNILHRFQIFKQYRITSIHSSPIEFLLISVGLPLWGGWLWWGWRFVGATTMHEICMKLSFEFCLKIYDPPEWLLKLK